MPPRERAFSRGRRRDKASSPLAFSSVDCLATCDVLSRWRRR
jgi:hypothetical protein